MADRIYTLDEVPEGFVPAEPKVGNQQAGVANFLSSLPLHGPQLSRLYANAPTFNPPAPVSMEDRITAEGLSSDPKDRAEFFRSKNYADVNIDPETEQATVGGERVDKHPFSAPSISEYVAEFITNLDSIGTATATALGGPLAGMGTAATIGGAREAAKVNTIPGSEVDVFGTGLEVAAESLPIVGKGAKPLLKSGGKALEKARPLIEKPVDLASQAILNTRPGKYVKGIASNVSELGKEAYQKYSGQLFDTLDETAKNLYKRFDDTFGVAGDLRNLGVGDDAFNVFNTVPITENYSRLIKENPAFKKIAYTGGPTVRGDQMYDLFNQTGETVKNYYKGTDKTASVADIFDTPAYKELREAIFSQGRESAEELLAVEDQVLRNMYDAVSKTMAKKSNPSASMEWIFKNTPDPRTIPKEEILEVLENSTLSLEELWDLRKAEDAMAGWTSTGRWFGDGADKNPLTSLVHRKFADSFRDVLTKNVDDPNVLKAIQDYSDMAPIVNAVAQKAAASMGVTFRPNDIYVSAIGGDLYRALGYAGKLLRSPAAKGITGGTLEKAKGVFSVEGIGDTAREVADPSFLQQFGSGMKRQGVVEGLNQKVISDENMSTTAPPESDALQAILGNIYGEEEQPAIPDLSGVSTDIINQVAPLPAPKPISRDPDLIGKTPDDLEMVKMAVSQNTALLFEDAITSNDPLKKRIAMAEVMKEAPEIFEPGLYGLRSVIAEEDRFVIGDPEEAKFYRQTIKHLRARGKIGANFYTKQLSALNDPTDLTVFVRPDVVADPKQTQGTEKSTLESIATSAGERRTYNY